MLRLRPVSRNARGALGNARGALGNARGALGNARGAVGNVRGTPGDVRGAACDLNVSLADVRDAAGQRYFSSAMFRRETGRRQPIFREIFGTACRLRIFLGATNRISSKRDSQPLSCAHDSLLRRANFDASIDMGAWVSQGNFFKSPAQIIVPQNADQLPRQVALRARHLEGNNPFGDWSDVVTVQTIP